MPLYVGPLNDKMLSKGPSRASAIAVNKSVLLPVRDSTRVHRGVVARGNAPPPRLVPSGPSPGKKASRTVQTTLPDMLALSGARKLPSPSFHQKVRWFCFVPTKTRGVSLSHLSHPCQSRPLNYLI